MGKEGKCFVVGGVFLLLLLLVLAIGTASAEHKITINLVDNGGFETGNFLGWVSDGDHYNAISDSDCYAGTYCNKAGMDYDTHYTKQEEVDLTYVDEISFAWKGHRYGPDPVYMDVKIDGATKMRKDYSSGWNTTDTTIDVSDIEGRYDIGFYYRTNYGCFFMVDSVEAEVTVDLEEIRNPSFERVVLYDANPLIQWSAWKDVNMVSGSHSEGASPSGDVYFHGSTSLKLLAEVDGTGTTSAGVTQKMDLSSSTPYLNFRMWSDGGEGTASIIVAVDGTPVWQYSGEALWQEFSAPLSGYYGTSEVSIYATASGGGSSITAYIDAVAFGEEKATVSGYTYDAGAGLPLSDVAIRMDAVWGSSNNLGFYSISAPLGAHTITATKPDYYDAVLPLTITHIGDYEMDIALIPKPTTYVKPSILGIVQTLPNYQPAKNQVVNIENATWADTATTNDFGYYAFHNLEAGNYYIIVSRLGYAPSGHSVTIMDTSVLHNIDLEPTEWSIIEIIIEKVMKWWWLLLLLIALTVAGLLMRGRKKIYVQHHPKKRK